MLRALVKKQLAEFLSGMFKRNNKGKIRTKGTLVFFGILMVYVVTVFAFLFYNVMHMLCKPFVMMDLGWLYFSLAGIMALALSVFGSVFATQSQLYQAKDNDFLLAMPIPPMKILLSRMISLYIQTFMFVALVMIPAGVEYFRLGYGNGVSYIAFAIILVTLPLLALTLSCILGWLVAFISSRMRNKSFMTMVLSLGFLFVYFYGYSRIGTFFEYLLTKSEKIGEGVKAIAYPLYKMGEGADGSVGSLFIYAGIVLAMFAVVYFALAKSFIKIVTVKQGSKKVKYGYKEAKESTIENALLRKEFSRFVSSPAYMMNAGLGIILLPIALVSLIMKKESLLMLISLFFELDVIIAFMGLIICMLVSTNIITAPSVSLEGRHLWIIQSFPISGEKILDSKIKLHLIICTIPTLICTVIALIFLNADIGLSALILIFEVLFILFCAESGMIINVKHPMLDWTNEAVPIKQSVSVMLSMFLNWAVVLLLGIGLYFSIDIIDPKVFMMLAVVLFAVIDFLMYQWIKNRGAKIMERLHK